MSGIAINKFSGLPLLKSHLCTLVLAVLAGLAPSAAQGHDLAPVRIAANVYAVPGDAGTVSTHNRGRVANAGFIVGPSGVIVIDTGVSYRHGQQIIRAVRSVTDLPVKLVVVTHAVREFVFGAAAFDETGVTLIAHRETVDLMKARCAHCLDQLNELLGHEMDGSRLVLPRQTVDDSTAVNAGGARIQLLYFGWAATPGDLAVFHPQSGTLFAGGLVSASHVPMIRDCDFEGWQSALNQLLKLPVRRVVPGFGPPSGRDSIYATARYLDALDARSRELYAKSGSLLDAVDNAQLPEFADWAAYDPNNRRNALHRRLQLELEDLGDDPRSTALPENTQ
jgi:glyoxylase-like metal-dependent hydrolase (beta-lactamase superfamily II)